MLVKLGNWLFHYRNILFPIFYAALFIPSTPILPSSYALTIGGIIIGLGVLIRCITIGFVYIVRGGKDRTIYANNLVTEGIYMICRNPMYLGNIMLILGFGIFSNSLIFLTVFFPLFLIIYWAIIEAEENFLFKKFGDDYEEYLEKTNALIPNLKYLKSATKNYRFDFIRVIRKEYNSTYLYLTGVLLLLVYKSFISVKTFLISFIILSCVYIITKILKRKNKLN